MRRLVPAVLLALAASSARADAAPAAFHTELAVDGPVTLAGVALGATTRLLPVTASSLAHEPFAFDEAFRGTLSPTASRFSDVLAAATVVAPIGLLLGPGVDRAAADRFALYAESLALTYGLNTAVKYLVQRPRPYSYGESAEVRRYTEEHGDDSYLSFYSGHAAITFAAAVTGAHLFAASIDSVGGRAAAWGGELLLASATSTLRVRAGKHFPSDVLTGALLGTLAGVLVPLTHRTQTNHYAPAFAEWAAMAGGVALGIGLGSVLPAPALATEEPSLVLSPTVLPGGGGLVATLVF